MLKTGDLPERKNITNKSKAYKAEVEMNSKRTLDPNMDLTSAAEEMNRRRGRKDSVEMSARGSILNLLDRTPANQPKQKKFAERLLQGNDIFTPADPLSTVKSKLPVDLDELKADSDYAGIKIVEKETPRGPR